MITVLLLAGALGCTPPSDASVVGFWESEATSRGGIGHSFELKSNGDLLSSTLVMVDQVYRVADGKLFTAETPKALNTVTNGMTFKIAKDLLVQSDADGGEIRKERLGAQVGAGGSLTGAWRYQHYTGAIAFELYTADGRVLFRLPMTSDEGCYDAANGSVTLATPKGKNTMQYTLDRATLTLRNVSGKPHAYRRADPWYPRDQPDYRSPKTDGRRGG